MKDINVTNMPVEYKKTVPVEQQGTITEITYSVNNYINQARKLVTNQSISQAEAGRETVNGEPIEKKFNVYLPAGYDSNDQNTKYNVLYLLHGVGGDRNEWLDSNGKTDENFNICNILDNLIAKGNLAPTIVVFPDGRSAIDWTDRSFNSEGTNMLGFYYLDYELRYDLIPFIESRYNTYADITDTTSEGIAYNRLHRSIAGLSMGGMQTLNMTFGGYRCDSSAHTGGDSRWANGLEPTVKTSGMLDLFAYAGAFSNAPTSSSGDILGAGIASSNYKLNLLYITCGEADEISYQSPYIGATDRLAEVAGDKLCDFYRVSIKGGKHDFKVWNNGIFNFLRLAFDEKEHPTKSEPVSVALELDD